jgi:phage recombination protein Bet
MANEITTPVRERSLVATMAESYGMGSAEFYNTLMKTAMPSQNASKEQVAAFLMVAHRHQLNPFTREIYAFPGKNGGIQPIVGIDGWMTLANRQPSFDGITFVDDRENGKLIAITAQVHRKDREHPVEVTEYLSECARNTDPWKQWPARMLRHKATIQAIRYAFGFSGIMEPDEAERMSEHKPTAARDITSQLQDEVQAEVLDVQYQRPDWADAPEELILTAPTGTAPEEVIL